MAVILSEFPETIAPTQGDEALAQTSSRSIARIVSEKSDTPLSLRVSPSGGDETVVAIPAAAFRLLGEILNQMAKGNAITLIPVHLITSSCQSLVWLHLSYA